jgi:uncharacterized membrane protein YphA (DoxX/SURF4 family)
VYWHVAYVTPPEAEPDPLRFLADVLSQPGNLLLLGAGAVVVAVIALIWLFRPPRVEAWDRFAERAWSYRLLVPWMLRLSFGLLLIGAGLSGVAFAPDVQIDALPKPLLTIAGFLLLLGLAVRPAAVMGLLLFGASLVLRPQLVGMFEVVGGLAAIALLGPGIPSLDDLLRAALPRLAASKLMTRAPAQDRYGDLVPLLVRLGLGGSFLASGIGDKILIYNQALETVAKYHLTALIPVEPGLWVLGAALTEASLGVAILMGAATRQVAIIAFAVLSLTLFGLPDDPVVAHIGLFGACSILVVLGGGRWSLDELRARHLGRRTALGTRPAVEPLAG